MNVTQLAELFKRDLVRLGEELRAFPDDGALWKTAPGLTNSAGNLALHLEGNLREFIGRQLGGVAYQRERPLEFSSKGLSVAEIAARIDAVLPIVVQVIESLPAARLEELFPEKMSGRDLTIGQVLIHLFGHFSYHLGQIDYLRRFLTGNGAIDLASL